MLAQILSRKVPMMKAHVGNFSYFSLHELLARVTYIISFSPESIRHCPMSNDSNLLDHIVLPSMYNVSYT